MNYSVEIITKLNQMAQLKTEWERLTEASHDQDFYLTFDWFYAVVNSKKLFNADLRIFVIWLNSEIQAIIPCMLREKRLRHFYVRSLELLGNIYSPRRGVIIRKNNEKEIANWFLNFLLSEYKKEWDLLTFVDLSPNDIFISTFKQNIDDANLWVDVQDLFSNVVIDLSSFPSGEDFFLGLSKKLRQNIRTSLNKHKLNGYASLFLFKSSWQDISEAISFYYNVYRKSWKKNEFDPEFHGRLCKKLVRESKIRLFFLCYNTDKKKDFDTDKYLISSFSESNFNISNSIPKNFFPIAVMYCIIHKKKAYNLKICYDEKYENLSPGTLLNWFAIKHLIEVDKCFLFDQQKGDESYKFQWKGKLQEIRFRLLFPNPCSIFIKINILSTAYLNRLWNNIKKKILFYQF